MDELTIADIREELADLAIERLMLKKALREAKARLQALSTDRGDDEKDG